MDQLIVNQPVLDVLFVGPKDEFKHRFLPHRDDPEAIEKIVARFAEDGYKPVPQSIRKGWINADGELEVRGKVTSLLGYRARSAFLRA